MSDAATQERTAESAPADIETRARLMGWRPQGEFKGPAAAWKPAEEFVRHGEEDLPLVREHNRRLEARLIKMDRDLAETREAAQHLTEMTRTSEERAYKRARADLEAQRRAAVASGDTAGFDAAEAEMKALEGQAPKPAPKPKPQQQGDPHPDAIAWAAQNPWFNADEGLKREAIAVHGALLQSHPDLSLAENLRRVTAMVRVNNPDKFREAAQDDTPAENPRRQQAASVAASSAGGGPQRVKPRSFEAMPAASKEAFTKYSTQLKGKGAPLTKEEWAETYWSQFGEE